MIDLTPFCATVQEGRTSLTTPWSRGAYTYATNGHIGVRVDRRDDVTRDDGPDMDKTMASVPAPVRFVAMPEIPPPAGIQCPTCQGYGHVAVCKHCDGNGEKECGECGHISECQWCESTGTYPVSKDRPNAEVCTDCGGHGKSDNQTGATQSVRLSETLYIDARYARLIAALPNAEIDTARPFDGSGIWFRFDGGIGVVMPLRPPVGIEAARNVTDLTDRIQSAA